MFRASFVALLLITSLTRAADEPTFNGLKASEYMAMAKDDPLPRKRKAAILALGQFITDKPSRDLYLPAITKAMRSDSQATVRQQAAMVMGQQPAETLAGYITDLTEGLRQEKDSGVRKEIATCIGRIGKAAQAGVLPLIDTLKDAAPATRAAAAEALGRIGAGANSAAASLIALTKDSDAKVRYGAVFALGRIDTADPDATVASIIAVLDAEKAIYHRFTLLSAVFGGAASGVRDSELVTAGVVSLGLLGVKTNAAAQAIAAHINDPDADVRQQVVLSLGKLTVAARNVEAELKAAIRSDVDKHVRTYAVQTFSAAFAAEPEPMIAFFSERLKAESDFEVRIALVDELGGLGAAGSPAIIILREAQKDTQVKVREAAADAIKKILKPAPTPKPDQSAP